MTLLDTNLISELAKKQPNPKVATWLNKHEPDGLFISAITVAELRVGLADLPEGKRKHDLTELIEELLERFGNSVSFGSWAAEEYAAIVIARKRQGRPIELFDALIAATARAQSLALATMNTKDFEGIDGLKVIDPSA